ncbi:hypothetical protein LIA77_11671 [Sarocladium implicatum]|nr:hypothetical protein LIA77_11671 [Sarocladium implicatum]
MGGGLRSAAVQVWRRVLGLHGSPAGTKTVPPRHLLSAFIPIPQAEIEPADKVLVHYLFRARSFARIVRGAEDPPIVSALLVWRCTWRTRSQCRTQRGRRTCVTESRERLRHQLGIRLFLRSARLCCSSAPTSHCIQIDPGPRNFIVQPDQRLLLKPGSLSIQMIQSSDTDEDLRPLPRLKTSATVSLPSFLVQQQMSRVWSDA